MRHSASWVRGRVRLAPPLLCVTDIGHLPPHTLHELQNFFEDYKELENKAVSVLGFEGREVAWQCIRESLARYDQQIKPTR